MRPLAAVLQGSVAEPAPVPVAIRDEQADDPPCCRVRSATSSERNHAGPSRPLGSPPRCYQMPTSHYSNGSFTYMPSHLTAELRCP